MGAARGEPSGGAIPMRGAAEPRLLSALRIGGLSENTAENGNRYFRMKEPPLMVHCAIQQRHFQGG